MELYENIYIYILLFLGNILIWALTNVDNSTFYELAIDMEAST